MSKRKVFSIKYLVFSIKISVFVLILYTLYSILNTNVLAQKPEDWEPPERNGVYNVPGRNDLKVRVFVHEPPNQSPVLIACSADNNSGTPVDALTGWHLPNGTWNYYLNSASAPTSVGSANVTTLAANAFNTWQSQTAPVVTFNKAGESTKSRKALDNINLITWGRTSGSALAVATTWYYTATNEVAETDIIFNKKFPWGWSTNTCNSNYYDAQNILTHEVGHWTGLEDMYDASYADNTMYGYGAKGEIKKDSLSSGDISAVTTLH